MNTIPVLPLEIYNNHILPELLFKNLAKSRLVSKQLKLQSEFILARELESFFSFLKRESITSSTSMANKRIIHVWTKYKVEIDLAVSQKRYAIALKKAHAIFRLARMFYHFNDVAIEASLSEGTCPKIVEFLRKEALPQDPRTSEWVTKDDSWRAGHIICELKKLHLVPTKLFAGSKKQVVESIARFIPELRFGLFFADYTLNPSLRVKNYFGDTYTPFHSINIPVLKATNIFTLWKNIETICFYIKNNLLCADFYDVFLQRYNDLYREVQSIGEFRAEVVKADLKKIPASYFLVTYRENEFDFMGNRKFELHYNSGFGVVLTIKFELEEFESGAVRERLIKLVKAASKKSSAGARLQM